MASSRIRQGLRRIVRFAGAGFLTGLLALALAVAIVSFLTACQCMEPFVPKSP